MLLRLFIVLVCLVPVGAGAQTTGELQADAFEAAQWAQMTSAGAALAQVGARFAAGTDDLARAVRARQDLVERWQELDKAQRVAVARNDADAQATDRMREQADELAAKAEAADRDLLARFPEYAELSNPKPLPLAEAQKLLAPEEALLMIVSGTDASYVFAITRGAVAWNRVALKSADIAETVRALRSTLDPTAPARGKVRAAESAFDDAAPVSSGAGFDRKRAFALYTSLIAPVEPTLASAKRLLIVVDGPLGSLPFSVLPTAAPQGSDSDPDALRGTPWLIRRWAPVTLPSVGSLRALRAFERRKAEGEAFRGFGAPLLNGAAGGNRGVRAAGAYFSGAGANVEAVRSLAPLPATATELRRIAQALGQDERVLRLGDKATEAAVKRENLSNVRLLAFATHGLVAGELAGLAEPALVFSPPDVASTEDDGLLTASEAATLKLSADWVVLSACNTAASDGTPGADGLSGLARAFFFAGARTLLVSHWPVRDDAAAALTSTAFALIRDDPTLPKAEALRRSMVALMERSDDPSLAHPSAWAPFVLVGEGR